MAQKDRRVNKKRGSRTCGWGNAQKHRGAGSRGGRGNAGSKKHKWCKISKYSPGKFGRTGFKRPLKILEDVYTINVSKLDLAIQSHVSAGKATEKSGKYSIDLDSIGITKLLGSGKVTKKIDVKVDSASARAVAKIEAAGGSVTVKVSKHEDKSETVESDEEFEIVESMDEELEPVEEEIPDEEK